MGTPNYPKDMATEWNKLKRDVKDAFTSANQNIGKNKVGQLGDLAIQGSINVSDGSINVDGSGLISVGNGGAVSVGDAGSVNVGTGGAVNVGANGSVNVDDGGSVNVGVNGSVNVDTGGEVNVGTNGSINVASGGDVNIGASGSVNVDSGGSVNLGTDGSINVGSGGDINITEGSLSVFDNSANKKAEIGKLSDGDYGVALVNSSGQLTKLSNVVFGPTSNQVSTKEGLPAPSSSFTNLATVGPSVTVNIGQTGRALVIVTCNFDYQCINDVGGGVMSFQVTGPGPTTSPSDQRSVMNNINSATSSGTVVLQFYGRQSATIFLTGLTPGSNTFTAKYRNVSTTNMVFFEDREITVLPY